MPKENNKSSVRVKSSSVVELSPGLVYMPKNGCLVHKGAIVIRMIYAEKELVKLLLPVIKDYAASKELS
jgi:hypothetical protein